MGAIKNHKRTLLFISVLIIQVSIMLYFGVQKQGLFGDEVWTFNLANHYFNPYLGSVAYNQGIWLSKDFWTQALVVDPEHRFSIGSVFYNQAQDVHPPLFYIIVHILSSIFPGVFSKWFVLLPNIVYFAVTQLFMYKLACKVSSSYKIQLSIVVFYGFSWGIINNIVYLRMYALSSMFGVALLLLHIYLLEAFSYKKLLATFIVMFLGIFTQYYFIIYSFFLALGYIVLQARNKQYARIGLYCLGGIITLLAVYGIFPAIIDQLTGKSGSQGQGAFYNLKHSSLGAKAKIFASVINGDLFGGQLEYFISIAGLLILDRIYRKYRTQYITEKQTSNFEDNSVVSLSNSIIYYVLFVAVAYFLLVSKIAPYSLTRYIVIIYPLIIILFVKCITWLSHQYRTIPSEHLVIISLLVFTLIGLKNYSVYHLFSYDGDYVRIEQIVQEQPNGINMVMVTKGDYWKPISQLMRLRLVDGSYILKEDKLNQLPSIIEPYEMNHKAILIYLDDGLSENALREKLDFIKDNTEYKKYQLLSTYWGNLYLFEK